MQPSHPSTFEALHSAIPRSRQESVGTVHYIAGGRAGANLGFPDWFLTGTVGIALTSLLVVGSRYFHA